MSNINSVNTINPNATGEFDLSFLEPATEEVVLPSKGLFYINENSILKQNNGKILIRPMTFKEEQILISPRILRSGQLISDLLRSVIKTSNVDVEHLLSSDRIFLFYYLRTISYGPMYDFMVSCSHCGNANVYTIDLSKLKIKYADPKKDKEPIELELPVIKKKVFLRFSRGFDESAQIQNSLEGKDLTAIDILIRLTVDIEGVPKQYWYKFYENLNVRDAFLLKNAFVGKETGLQNNIDLVCKNPQCSKEFNTDIPLNPNFFRPSQQ